MDNDFLKRVDGRAARQGSTTPRGQAFTGVATFAATLKLDEAIDMMERGWAIEDMNMDAYFGTVSIDSASKTEGSNLYLIGSTVWHQDLSMVQATVHKQKLSQNGTPNSGQFLNMMGGLSV